MPTTASKPLRKSPAAINERRLPTRAEARDIANSLRLSVFQGVPQETIEGVVAAAGVVAFERNQLLWLRNQDQPHDHDLVVVLEGALRVESPQLLRPGQRMGRLYRIVRRREVLGITTCIGEGRHGVAVHSHYEGATFAVIDGDKVREAAEAHPVVYKLALQHACKTISSIDEQLDLDREMVRENLRRLLPKLAVDGVIDLTRDDLRDAVGCRSKKSVTKALKDLSKAGFLSLRRARDIGIPDADGRRHVVVIEPIPPKPKKKKG